MTLRAASPALAAALLFGASTPLSKLLGSNVSAWLLAGLLYLGSGLGLGLLLAWRRHQSRDPVPWVAHVPPAEWPWLLGAILSGGVLGPALLMLGLDRTTGASASLLLNMESVLTALIAWGVFREGANRQLVAGMALIVLGGVLLSWTPGDARPAPGALLILGACLCWAIDNNLTRKVSSNDAMLIAGLKGVLAGVFSTSLALATGASLPSPAVLAGCLLVGFFGYGLSLTLFVVALRTLGTARTGAYFSVAPLFGVALSFTLWPEVPGALFWLAAALMALGVWLHVRERHEHEHTHEPLEHSHAHRHDEHHRHAHAFAWSGEGTHAHPHQHVAMTHRHPHYPDIHHRHAHPH